MLSKEVIEWFDDEAHEDLIDEGNLTKILKACPVAISSELLSMLLTTIPENVHEDVFQDVVYGIKSIDGYRTLSLGKHNGVNYNINTTASQGMKGGYQVGFKAIKDAVKFIEKLPSGLMKYRVSAMQPSVVKSYVWQEVDSVYGKCYATNNALEQYDPIKAEARREVNKIINTIKREWRKYFFTEFGSKLDEVRESIFNEFPPLETVQPVPDPGFRRAEGTVTIIETYSDRNYFIRIEDVAAKEDDIPRIQEIIRNITGIDTKVHYKYMMPEKRSAIQGYIGSLLLDPRVSAAYTDIKSSIEAKYGIV